MTPLSDYDRAHIIAARSGLIHALISVRNVINHESPDARYREIPLRFTRKRRDAKMITDALRLVEADIDRQQIACADRIAADDRLKATAANSVGTEAPLGRSAPTIPPANGEG